MVYLLDPSGNGVRIDDHQGRKEAALVSPCCVGTAAQLGLGFAGTCFLGSPPGTAGRQEEHGEVLSKDWAPSR